MYPGPSLGFRVDASLKCHEPMVFTSVLHQYFKSETHPCRTTWTSEDRGTPPWVRPPGPSGGIKPQRENGLRFLSRRLRSRRPRRDTWPIPTGSWCRTEKGTRARSLGRPHTITDSVLKRGSKSGVTHSTSTSRHLLSYTSFLPFTDDRGLTSVVKIKQKIKKLLCKV